MRKLATFAGALVFTLAFAPGVEAKKPRCKKKERWVEAGAPVLGGPGLGFETVAVTKASACVRVLRATPDGSFALISIEKERVGWVATGLVDAQLSEDEKAEPVVVEGAKPVKALLEAALREAPRIDAKATGVVKQGADLEVKGRSPDGLWLYVEARKEKGWIPRYQTAESVPEAGAAPSAGTGAWAVRSTTTANAEPAPDKKAEKTAKKAGKKTEKKGRDEKSSDEKEGVTDGGAATDAGALDGEPAPRTGPLLGRSQDLSIAVTPVAHWGQRYLSNAQNDPFYKYDLSSVGGGGAVGYAYRGDFPLVVDARLAFGMFGFDITAPGPDGQPLAYYRSVATVDTSAAVGWRLVGSETVDVEASAGVGLSAVWLDGLDDGAGNIVTPAFTPGLYLHLLRPSVTTRSRLGGGDLGLLVLEAALPIGAYLMLDDPGDRYLQGACVDPPTVQPPGGTQRPGDVPPDPAANPKPVGCNGDDAPPLFHLGFGAEGKVRYLYPLGDLLRFETTAGVEVRQALIAGPGVRVKGAYSEATNIDVTAGVTVGLDFAF